MSTGAIEWFRQRATEEGRTAAALATGRPLVGVFCNFVPEELILAAGALPLRLDSGDAVAAAEAEEVFPTEACPAARASVGVLRREGPLREALKLLIVPTPCDAKRKMAHGFEFGIPSHALSLPADKGTEGGRRAWLEEIRGLASVLGKLTGKPVTRHSLREAIESVNARQQVFREVLALRRETPPRLTGSELFAVSQASFLGEPQSHTQAMRKLVGERTAGAPLAPGRRVLLTGAPVLPGNDRLVEIVESTGLHIVADDLCSGTERLYHPVQPSEWTLSEMLLASAERALLPCTCPCFTRDIDRVTRLLQLSDEYAVDGVIYHNLRGCVLFQFETRDVRDAFRERGVPLLEISTDYGAQDAEQVRTRIQAFAEMLG